MAEKRTKENNREKGGLNDGNPNTDHTPIQPGRLENLTGGVQQHNYIDEIEGRVQWIEPEKNNNEDPGYTEEA